MMFMKLYTDFAKKITKKRHYCSVRCITKLNPFKKDIEHLARNKTSVGCLNRLLLNKRGKKLQSLLNIAYINDKILRQQAQKIKLRNLKYSKMADQLMLVSPDFIQKMFESINNSNTNAMTANAQLSMPPPENLKIAHQESKNLSDMETGIKPYNHTEYNKSLTQHLGNLNTYTNKMTLGDDANISSQKPENIVNTQNILTKLRGSVPKTYIRHAEGILELINQSNGRLAIDNSDNSLIADGRKISNSNAIDLITFLVGKKSKNPTLPGLGQFVNTLIQLGMPKSLINDASRLQILESGVIPEHLEPKFGYKNTNNSKAESVQTPRSKVKHQEDPPTFSPPRSIKPTKKKNKKKRGHSGSGTWDFFKQGGKNIVNDDMTSSEHRQFAKWLKKQKK